MFEVVHPKKSDAWMPFVPGIKVGPGSTILFVSGCTATPLYHKHPHVPEEITPSPEIADQARAVFNNIKLVLDAAGATFQDVVKVTRFLTDMKDQDVVNQVAKEYFGDHLPTSTTIEVSSLVTKELKLEIEAIAVIKG